MGLEQIWLLEKLQKRFKMKPLRTSIEISFLSILFIAVCIFGVGYLPEKGRQLATMQDSLKPETTSDNKTPPSIGTYVEETTESGTWSPSIQYTTKNAHKFYVQPDLVEEAKYTLNQKTAKISFDFLATLKKIPIGSALAISGLPVVVESKHVTEFNIHQTGLNYKGGELTVSARDDTTYFGIMVNTGREEEAYIIDGSESPVVRFWGYIIYDPY